MWSVVRRVLHMSGNLAKRIKLGFFFSFLDAVFEMFPFLALYQFLISVQNNTSLQALLPQCLLLLAIGILGRTVSKYLLYRFQSAAGFEFVARERLAIGNHLRKVPMGFFHENTLGDITATTTTDLNFLELYSMHVLDRVSTGIISMIVMGIAVFLFDWRLGMVFIVGVASSLFVYQIMQKKSKDLSEKQRVAQSKAISATLEYTQGISVIKAFNMSQKSMTGIEDAYGNANKALYKLEKTYAPLSALYSICFRIASAAILFLGSCFVIGNELDFARFVVVLIASFTVFNPLEVMGQMTLLFCMMEACLNRVEKIKNARQIDEDSKDFELSAHDISFSNACFSYEEGEEILRDINFSIPSKTMTAIVGPSGCGKTTVTRLIARFWDVDSGSVKIGSTDVRALTCDSLLKNISMVFQNVYLFNDTIRNNILLARPDAHEEEMIDAAKKAQCHSFIIGLPDGYDTVIGEGGGTLSGGEKQRISIARAILKDAPIVLLDEATASVDPENEVLIQNAIRALVKDKTLVVIAHRLTTVQDAEQILVMGNGSIVDKGTHNELIQRDGQYKAFWEIRENAGRWRLGHKNQNDNISQEMI